MTRVCSPIPFFALLAATIATIAPFPAGAEDDAVELGTISVTEPAQSGAGLAFERIDRREIGELPEASAAGVLSRLPSVQVTDNARGESVIQLRGFDQQQLLVLIDGAPSAIPFDGVLDLGKLPSAMIERIEVVKGSGSAVYGPGGLGGAINIMTRSPEDAPIVEFTAEGSPVHEVDGSLLHGGRIGKFRYSIFGGFDDRKDFPLSADFSATPNQGSGERVGSGRVYGYGGGTVEVDLNGRHRLGLSGNVVGGRYGVPPSVFSPKPKYWRFDPWVAATAQLRHEGRYLNDRLEISETLFASPFGNTLRSYDDANYNSQTKPSSFISTYDDLAAGGFLRARLSLKPSAIEELNFRLWGGGRYEKHGESSAGVAGETQYSHWLITLAPQVDARLSPLWTVTAGAQVDAEVPDRFAGVVEPKNQLTAGPFVAAGFTPTDSFEIAVSAARRARFPTLKERFADAFGQRLTNPGLGAEKAWNFSLDATARLPAGFELLASVFDSELSGLIVRVPAGAGLYQLQNAGRARLAGAEAEVRWKNEDLGLSLRGGYQFLWARRLDSSFPESQLEYRPEHKAYASVGWEFLKGFRLMNEAVITGPRPYLNTDTGSWGRLNTNATWNARLEGAVAEWMELWLSATNLVDLNNTGEYGYPMPGRQIWAGLKIVERRPKIAVELSRRRVQGNAKEQGEL